MDARILVVEDDLTVAEVVVDYLRHAGLLAAASDLVCFCDCDGSLDPRQLPLLTAPLLAGQADLVLGRRRTYQRDAWPLPARLANWELARRIRRRTGLGIRDLGPMRAAGREALRTGIPHNEVRIFPDLGHDLIWQNPAAIAATLTDFLKK